MDVLVDPIDAALAIARGSGIRAQSVRRPCPGEVHEPGWYVYLRSGEWTWSDFISAYEDDLAGRAERSVKLGMRRLEEAQS